MLIGQLAIVVTVLGWLSFVVLTLTRTSISGASDRPALDLATIGYLVIMSLLACSALAYLTTRLGYYSRTRSHRRTSRAELSQPFERSAPSLTVLVPSYQEDERVIRMTLLSAALQEYPDLELVLLIDDPPEPRYAGPAAMLAAARACRARSRRCWRARRPASPRRSPPSRRRFGDGGSPSAADVDDVAAEYEYAAALARPLRRRLRRSSTTPTPSSSSRSCARSPPTCGQRRRAARGGRRTAPCSAATTCATCSGA